MKYYKMKLNVSGYVTLSTIANGEEGAEEKLCERLMDMFPESEGFNIDIGTVEILEEEEAEEE